MEKQSKIYLAGHSGLVGSTIYRALTNSGYNNIVTREEKELDLRRQTDVEQFFDTERPEYIFLAAAKVGGIVANNTYKAEFIYDNIAICSNVINSAFKFGAKKLLNLGSSCIYPKFVAQPLREDSLLTGALEPTNEPYAIAKIVAIKLCSSYNFQYGTDYISLMPTNLYGAGDNFNLETSHVVPALIRKFVLAKNLSIGNFELIIKDLKSFPLGFKLEQEIDFNDENSVIVTLGKLGITKESIKLWGTGTPRREFLHVEDLAAAVLYFMENHSWSSMGDFINIGTATDLSINELAQLIKGIIGFNGNLEFDHTKPDGTPQKLLDVSRAQLLGWRHKITLEEGIKRTINDYILALG